MDAYSPQHKFMTLVLVEFYRKKDNNQFRSQRIQALMPSETQDRIDKKIKAFKGELIETTNNYKLISFTRPTQATLCALEIKNILKYTANTTKISIHSGDVAEREGIITGDAVRILEEMHGYTSVGELAVTEVTYSALNKEEIKHKAPIADLITGFGMKLFSIMTEEEHELLNEEHQRRKKRKKNRRVWEAILGALIVLIVVGIILVLITYPQDVQWWFEEIIRYFA